MLALMERLGKEAGARNSPRTFARVYPVYAWVIFFLFAYDAKGINGWDDIERSEDL